jgi:hypothetical protein
MDLSEHGKCLFTSLQYVESSQAPYQRIRFFPFRFVPFRFVFQPLLKNMIRAIKKNSRLSSAVAIAVRINFRHAYSLPLKS